MTGYSVTTMSVGGIAIQVVGLEELTHRANSHPEPVGVLFLLHGRLGNSKQSYLKRIAKAVLAEASSHPPHERAREVIVVILDHRNHGERTVDPDRNQGWKETGQVSRLSNGQADPKSLDNVTHLHDMYSLYTGTVNDVSFLITHLQPLLFRHDERTIDKWMMMGISLGGHASWHIGAHDPRISLLVPVIGSPSYLTLFKHRADGLGISLDPPYLPKSLKQEMERSQPKAQDFRDKDVLVLSGADDELVPFTESGSKEFTERLAAARVCKSLQVWVQPDTGHTCSPEMIMRAKDFIWTHGIRRTDETVKSNL